MALNEIVYSIHHVLYVHILGGVRAGILYFNEPSIL